MTRSIARRNIQGFTLVELLVALAIMAILVATAAPTLTRSITMQKMNKEARQFHTALKKTRDMAVNHSVPSRMCAGDEDNGCAGSWNDGWIVFADTNNDGTYTGSDIIGQSYMGLDDDVTATVSNQIVFNAQGFAENVVDITLCHSSGEAEYSRFLRLSNSGVISRSYDSDGDGIHNQGAYSKGGNVACP